MNVEGLSARLEAEATTQGARAAGQHVRTIRGIRGTPPGIVARIGSEAWRSGEWALPRAEDALGELFGAAWEDGLVAVGLLAANGPDRPRDVLEISREWLARIDDTATADALGWLVVGPATFSLGLDVSDIVRFAHGLSRPHARRAVVMAGMAALPVPIEGPAAAPLRERMGTRDVMFVAEPLSNAVSSIAHGFVRDDDPVVRKAMRRVLGAWAAVDADAATTFIDEVKGGAPAMLRQEVAKSARKGRH